jgi:nucleotide-binding universal stress UspA family protein
MITRILLGYDGSPAASRALEFAVDLARRYGAELHVLAVFRPPEFGTEVETEELIEEGRKHCARLLQPLRAKLGGGDPKVRFEIAVGHPSEQLLLYAEKHGVDHIVVGHRGHSGLARWLLGSVARQVIAHASCAVTVVRG